MWNNFGGLGGGGGGPATPVSVANGGTGTTDRTLARSDAAVRFDWQGGYLNNNAGIQVISLGAQQLTTPTGGSVTVDWANMYLKSSGTNSINWASGIMYDAGGAIQSVHWYSRLLVDDAGETAANWSLRRLYNSQGSLSADWETKSLWADAGGESLYWGVRTLGGTWKGTVQPNVPAALTISSGLVATSVNDGDFFVVTADAAFTLSNPTGTRTDGMKIIWRFNNNGSGAITLGSDFRLGSDIAAVALTATNGKSDYMAACWDATDSKWDVISLVKGY